MSKASEYVRKYREVVGDAPEPFRISEELIAIVSESGRLHILENTHLDADQALRLRDWITQTFDE